MVGIPSLEQFRVETAPSGVVHLVFDAPGRSMNVFSNAAIHELAVFAAWLRDSGAPGAVVRSGKANAFCAGADLSELGVAYDMIMAAPKAERFQLAFDHFFPFSRALRALETSGKPVAAAIAGLALGGGCELALGCHHRVLVDDGKAALGVPESLVGLFPGAGGTQRLPRMVGIAASLPLLLDGARLAGQQALEAGLVDALVAPGTEVAAAERWVLAQRSAVQPWDRPGWTPPDVAEAARIIGAARTERLRLEQGHYPAPLAILDCIERGIAQPIDAALRTEMEIFAVLIQRPEPRNMIQTSFLGRLDHDKRAKAGTLPAAINSVQAAVAAALHAEARRSGQDEATLDTALAKAGFTKSVADMPPGEPPPLSRPAPIEGAESAGLWFEKAGLDAVETQAARFLFVAARAAAGVGGVAEGEVRVVDHAVATAVGFPAYLGGPLALARYLGSERLDRLIGTGPVAPTDPNAAMSRS